MALSDRHQRFLVIEQGAVPTIFNLVLNGANPGELPVQMPSRFELVVNLRTARMLGLSPPPALLGRADEVID